MQTNEVGYNSWAVMVGDTVVTPFWTRREARKYAEISGGKVIHCYFHNYDVVPYIDNNKLCSYNAVRANLEAGHKTIKELNHAN